MAFDIVGAKRAGFSDSEIAQEMAGKYGFNYGGARESGFSDQEIIGEMLSKSDAGVATPARANGRAPWDATGVSFRNEPQPKKPVDARKVSYTDSGYTPNKRAETPKEFAKNLVQDVVEAPLFPVNALRDVANSPNTLSTLAELGKGLVKTPLSFVPFVAEPVTGKTATENWLTNPGVGAMLAGAVAKPATRLAGSIGKGAVERTRPAPTELQRLSREHNVPLTAGEEINSPNMKQVESRLERLPLLGIRGFRKKQGESLANSAANLAEEFSTAVDDPSTVLGDRFKSNLKKSKELSSEAYNKVRQELEATGTVGEITPNSTRTVLKGLLAKSPDIFERLPGSQNRLKNIMAEIAGDTAPKQSTIPVIGESGMVRGHHGQNVPQKVLLGPDGKPITKKTLTKLTYDDYVWLRDQVGEYIDRAHKSAGAVGSNEMRQLTLIKKALDSDFYTWGKNSGFDNVTAAVDNARKVYRENVAPFENVRVLKSIVNDKFTPEQLLDAIAKPGQATLAKSAMKGLAPKDTALVQDAIMRRALATGTEGGVSGAPFSAAKFATFFEKMDTKTKNAAQTPMDVFFTPEQKAQVMGFAKLARAAERSSQYQTNPLTGVAAADFAIPGAIAGVGATLGVSGAASLAAVTKAMSIMLTSKAGKSLLYRAYRTPAGAAKAWDSMLSLSAKLAKDETGLFAPFGGDIRAQKGQFSDLTDRKAKIEIDDSGAKWKPGSKEKLWALDVIRSPQGLSKSEFNRVRAVLGGNDKSVNLVDILDHKKLYSYMPELKRMPVKSISHFDEAFGTKAAAGDMKIYIDPYALDINTTLHEIQHVIQDIGDFAKGGDISYKSELISKKEKELAEIKRDPEFVKAQEESQTVDRSKMSFEDFAEKFSILKTALKLHNEIAILKNIDPHKVYRRIAGEEEARRVSARANMTAQDRMGRPYQGTDIKSLRDLIVR